MEYERSLYRVYERAIFKCERSKLLIPVTYACFIVFLLTLVTMFFQEYNYGLGSVCIQAEWDKYLANYNNTVIPPLTYTVD